jgi:hypothetical protein
MAALVRTDRRVQHPPAAIRLQAFGRKIFAKVAERWLPSQPGQRYGGVLVIVQTSRRDGCLGPTQRRRTVTNKPDARRLLEDLARVDGVERGLEDRFRRVLSALILARETQAHLQRQLHAVEGRANGWLGAALVADEDAQRYRDLLMSMQADPPSRVHG